MGFFSWATSEGDSISNRWSSRGALKVFMHDDKGNIWGESDYDGYGDFGGMDYYKLVDMMNGGAGNRDRGIHMSFSGDPDLKLPRFSNKPGKYDKLTDPVECPDQGYFY
mgnify:CR=1 FL=1|jgi:hypothetical protein